MPLLLLDPQYQYLNSYQRNLGQCIPISAFCSWLYIYILGSLVKLIFGPTSVAFWGVVI